MAALTNDKILVIGGSGALGTSLLPQLQKTGASPIVADIQIPAAPFDVLPYYELDAQNAKSTESCIRKIEADGHRLSHIVNIVGGLAETGLTNMFKSSAEEIENTIKLNLLSQLYPVRFMGQHLMATDKPNKSFVLISSINALAGYSIPFYTAAKGGLRSFIRPAAIELGAQNVRINAVTLGSVFTPSTAKQPKNFEARRASAPLRRLCTTNEAAEAIITCLSLTAMTGQELIVDAGQSVNPSESLYDQVRKGDAPAP